MTENTQELQIEENESMIRVMVRSCYSLQKLRIQLGNRLYAQFRRKVLGLKAAESEEELDKQKLEILKNVKSDYELITDGIVNSITVRNFRGNGVITDYTEFCIVKGYMDMLESEENNFGNLVHELKKYPIYTEFLLKVKGCGPAMSAVIISEMDPRAAKYPSSFCKYAGLDVVTMVENENGEMQPLAEGEARSCRKAHLITVPYIDSSGNVQEKKSVTFKPFLRAKLLGVLGPSFIKAGIKKGDNKYGKMYYDYKLRLQNMPKHSTKSKMHLHRMAIRYAVKQFLIDLHIKWRELEGLPVSTPYAEGKLGYRHGVDLVD